MNLPPVVPNAHNNLNLLGGLLITQTYNESIVRYVDACEILQIDPRLEIRDSVLKKRLEITHTVIRDKVIDPNSLKIRKFSKQEKKILIAIEFLSSIYANKNKYEKMILTIRKLNKKKRIKIYEGTVSKEFHYKEPQFLNSAQYIKWQNRIMLIGFLIGISIPIIIILAFNFL